MVFEKGKCIYIAVSAWGATDCQLISAIFGYEPLMEMRRIIGKESTYLWSKNKMLHDVSYSAIEALMGLHKIDDGLDLFRTLQGDIIIYRARSKNRTFVDPQEVLDSYNRYISSRLFIKEEKKEENKTMTIKENNYIYITTNTSRWSDDNLITALLGCVPSFAGREKVLDSCTIFWSRTKLSKDYSFDRIKAVERLCQMDDKLKFAMTSKGDIIIYRDINNDETEIFRAYSEYNKEDNKMTIKVNNYIYIATNTIGSSDNQLIAALLGYVPTYAKYEKIYLCGPLWSRTKFLKERDFDVIDARRRLQEMDEKLNFATTYKGDIIIYRNINIDDAHSIINAYDEFSLRDDMESYNPLMSNYNPALLRAAKNTMITMPRNLGRSEIISILNSHYGLNGGLLNWNTWCYEFKLYFGVERATGKQKTVCLWKDGEKTVIRGDESVLRMPVQYAVAWCYVKRRFKTTSQFKKYVDNHSFVLDGITYFEGDARVKGAQASVNNRTKKYDIYDAAALAITAKHYGSVKTIMNYCDGWGE